MRQELTLPAYLEADHRIDRVRPIADACSLTPVADLGAAHEDAIMSRLTLRFQPDPLDDVAMLYASVVTPGFCGSGGTWAQPSELEAFARELSEYPLPAEAPPSVRLGYNMCVGDDLVIGLTVKPADLRGGLLVLAEIADASTRAHRVRTTFATKYPDVERFQRALTRLAKGEAEQAVLEGN